MPPVRLVSAKADVNGGVKATIRAETGDQAAAEQLRDVVRGFLALARLQGGSEAGVRERAEIDPAVGHRQDRPAVLRDLAGNGARVAPRAGRDGPSRGSRRHSGFDPEREV